MRYCFAHGGCSWDSPAIFYAPLPTAITTALQYTASLWTHPKEAIAGVIVAGDSASLVLSASFVSEEAALLVGGST